MNIIYLWGPHQLPRSLIGKNQVVQGYKVITCDEIYTDRTCDQCGFINRDIYFYYNFDRNINSNYNVYHDFNVVPNILLRCSTGKVIFTFEDILVNTRSLLLGHLNFFQIYY